MRVWGGAEILEMLQPKRRSRKDQRNVVGQAVRRWRHAATGGKHNVYIGSEGRPSALYPIPDLLKRAGARPAGKGLGDQANTVEVFPFGQIDNVGDVDVDPTPVSAAAK
jgi:hypothetical protein